jgi:hypothetical protein
MSHLLSHISASNAKAKLDEEFSSLVKCTDTRAHKLDVDSRVRFTWVSGFSDVMGCKSFFDILQKFFVCSSRKFASVMSRQSFMLVDFARSISPNHTKEAAISGIL